MILHSSLSRTTLAAFLGVYSPVSEHDVLGHRPAVRVRSCQPLAMVDCSPSCAFHRRLSPESADRDPPHSVPRPCPPDVLLWSMLRRLMVVCRRASVARSLPCSDPHTLAITSSHINTHSPTHLPRVLSTLGCHSPQLQSCAVLFTCCCDRPLRGISTSSQLFRGSKVFSFLFSNFRRPSRVSCPFARIIRANSHSREWSFVFARIHTFARIEPFDVLPPTIDGPCLF